MRRFAFLTIRLAAVALIATIVLMPASVAAVDWLPIVPCGQEGQSLCTPCHLLQTGKNVIDLVLFGITGPIAAFMIVLAGGMMLLGGGKPDLFRRGRQYLTNTLIGVGIILIAWTATNFLIKGLGNGATGDAWYEFTCPAGLQEISAIDTEFESPLPPLPSLPPTQPPPAYIGKACPDSNVSLCGTAADLDVTCRSCDKIRGAYGSDIFQRYARGYISAGLLESIMLNESSCAKNLKSPAGAYGPMQLLPSTANMFTETCGIYDTDENGNQTPKDDITGAWLMSEANWEKGICLAAAYLNSLTGACGLDNRNLAAGYNGGTRACDTSVSCAGETSCGGGSKLVWECTWENRAHTVCNFYHPGGGFSETREYAPKVAACVNAL
jgi:hypothetical protein